MWLTVHRYDPIRILWLMLVSFISQTVKEAAVNSGCCSAVCACLLTRLCVLTSTDIFVRTAFSVMRHVCHRGDSKILAHQDNM